MHWYVNFHSCIIHCRQLFSSLFVFPNHFNGNNQGRHLELALQKMCFTHNPDFILITSFFDIMVTGVCKTYYYIIGNRNKDKILYNRVFQKNLVGKMLNNSESNFSPYAVSRKFPFLWTLIRGGKDACLLYTNLFPCDILYQI